ncbi:unnamed protein product [Hymenolepis diminuta]|uniref:BHLH domain-containing protein n=2 Tax=Hymenolepis diminuta TaxID=6216 RepID=A0A0R3S9Y5_HYMDI|nr:unnamed protein product [Hymenolepis diminuta]
MALNHCLRFRSGNFSNLRRFYLPDKNDYALDLDGDAVMPERFGCAKSSTDKNNISANFRSHAQRKIHSEIERQRRRDFAIIYELLRLCITEEDLRNFTSNIDKRMENISYAEILSISVRKLKKATKELSGINHVMKDIKQLERLNQRLNIPTRIQRPTGISMRFHQKVAEIVEDTIKKDARIRKNNGRNLQTPREVALGAQTALANLAKNAAVMRVIEDTITESSRVNHNAPTETAPINPETSIGVRGDIFHSGGHYPKPFLTTNQPTHSSRTLKSGNDDFNHNIPIESSQIDSAASIHLMRNERHISKYPNPDPVLTSVHFDYSVDTSQDCNITFYKDLDALSLDESILVDELYTGIMRDFELQNHPDNFTNDFEVR